MYYHLNKLNMMSETSYDVILDCYSDEPSGYGAPPFLGVHQRYISGALNYLKRKHFYLTIDDLRHAKDKGKNVPEGTSDISTLNLTLNSEKALPLMKKADTIYIVMGCFVDYKYVSAYPPKASELYKLLKDFKAKKVLIYVLGGNKEMPSEFKESLLFRSVDYVVTGLAYNFLLKGERNSFSPNYNLLAKITKSSPPIINQIGAPRVVEIESMIGCNWAKCSFCIERLRKGPVVFRKANNIIEEIGKLYDNGARYFRIGRNPNFYYYMKQNTSKVEALLYGIRERCPNLKVLHIDNVNPESVITDQGREITKLIVKYCTSGNIAPFGIESFDPVVRKINTLNSNVKQIMEAISILNEYGKEKGENGAPRFLNGINLIYNLPGQRPETLDYNLKFLQQIMKKGYQTRRLFFRRFSSPFGISMETPALTNKAKEKEYEEWKQKIYKNFSIPMLERVFPKGSILKNARAEVWKNGDSILLQLGTCPTRLVVKNRLLPIGREYDIKVKRVLKHRTLVGELLKDN